MRVGPHSVSLAGPRIFGPKEPRDLHRRNLHPGRADGRPVGAHSGRHRPGAGASEERRFGARRLRRRLWLARRLRHPEERPKPPRTSRRSERSVRPGGLSRQASANSSGKKRAPGPKARDSPRDQARGPLQPFEEVRSHVVERLTWHPAPDLQVATLCRSDRQRERGKAPAPCCASVALGGSTGRNPARPAPTTRNSSPSILRTWQATTGTHLGLLGPFLFSNPSSPVILFREVSDLQPFDSSLLRLCCAGWSRPYLWQLSSWMAAMCIGQLAPAPRPCRFGATAPLVVPAPPQPTNNDESKTTGPRANRFQPSPVSLTGMPPGASRRSGTGPPRTARTAARRCNRLGQWRSACRPGTSRPRPRSNRQRPELRSPFPRPGTSPTADRCRWQDPTSP
jgi:hypothetical protein